jgi:hypothetical protein
VGLTHEGPAETSVSSPSSAPMDRDQSSSCPTAAQLIHGGDIDQVMADQADLVTVLHTLHKVLNYKGT